MTDDPAAASGPRGGPGPDGRRARRRLADRPVLACLAATLVVSLVFLALPQLDRAATGLFYGPDGFAAATDPWLVGLRLAGRIVTRIAIVGLVVLLIAKALAPDRVARVPLRALLFLAASLAVGPGLAVNLTLKQYWHRPRPAETDLFGGDFPFGLPWMPTGGCVADCSFPSAEASAAIWWVAVALVVPVRWRKVATVAALLWATAISLNRIAFGGHYLSDVLIAWCLTLTLVFLLRDLILIRLPEATVARLEAGLARLGGRRPAPTEHRSGPARTDREPPLP
ncbi:phosphoesterase PA-phosphatase [Prosthecomicrobium hirschii]|uniref:phosphatase PAP2 family protein n=1 Tax=Prosthecodimorpha hirschii TaxID=665126 RepID=UPI00112B9FA3|nr:phosphatase PAP2 family protein [Prosthecomicrobium hirschii]TPQ49673.1 phosphoesterase PA-phosphatase [Prosthecomicrobium hirschii]